MSNKKKLSKKEKVAVGLYIYVITSLIATIIYILIRFIIGDLVDTDGTTVIHSRADYMLMLVQCVLGVIVVHIPSFLEKKFKIEIPSFLFITYLIFLHCAIFLGEVRSFYYLVPYWDSILHFLSSIMTGLFGFLVIDYLNKDSKLLLNLSPFFVALFAFCFSCMIGMLWEIYEFSVDGLLGFNMQKYMTADGTILTGHEALSDTMKDLIIDSIGALIASTLGFISLKNKNYWLFQSLQTGANKENVLKEESQILKA